MNAVRRILILTVALGCALALGHAGAADDPHAGHSHDTTAPAPAKAEAAKGTAVKAAAKAAPDSLPKLEAEVRRDSTNAKKLYRLGVAYLDRDRAAEASRMFQKAVTIKADYLEAWVNLGASQDALGHGADARNAYRRAIELRSDDEIALCRLASSFYATGQRDSAMAVLRQTIARNPRSHCSYFTLGVAYADAGMFREAIRVWDKVVEIAPKSPEAESARESITLLRQYLGSADSVAVASTGPVAPGAGGPGEPLPGGDMKAMKDAKGSSAKPKDAPKSGGK